MDIRVLGWRYQNIRGGLQDVTIDLGTPLPQWTLIQMPNGTGKTTTMSLLRAVFTGEQLSSLAVKEYRSADSVDSGLFEMRLSIDGKPYRIQLRLNFRDGSCSYWTARSEVQGGGLEEGLLLPHELRRLLTAEFTRLFVFDGELAKEIRTVGKERAADAIRTLYQLDRVSILNSLIDRLVTAEQQRAAAISTATELKGVRRWHNAHVAALAKKAELTQFHEARQQRSKQLLARRAKVRIGINERIEQDDTLKKRKEQLDAALIEINQSIFDLTARGLSALRSPPRLHGRMLDRLHALGGKLTRLKLPKTISAEFFRELAEQAECVCGRSIDQSARQAIIDRAAGYLAEDQILVINKMKLALRESSADQSEFATIIEALKLQLRALIQNKTSHDQLELERMESGDAELEQLRQEDRELETELQEIASAIERLTTRDASRQRQLSLTHETNLPLCEGEIKRCQEKLATATKTRQFVMQSERMKALVTKVATLALEQLRERVRQATNRKLEQLVPSEALRVARIGGALELESARLANKGGVSEGQSLAVAYAFLTSLLTDAPYNLPFIVDSPAVSLDTKVRREVGDLIPELFGQMIMFVISSEREGFADAFYDRSQVRYVTLWRETDDVTAVRDGLEFFRTFHALEPAQ